MLHFTTAAICRHAYSSGKVIGQNNKCCTLQQQLFAGMFTVQERLLDRTINVALRTASSLQQLYAGMFTVQDGY